MHTLRGSFQACLWCILLIVSMGSILQSACVELLCAAFANKAIKSEAGFPENEDMPTDFVSRIIAANVVVSDVGDVMTQAVNLLLARRAAALTGSSEMGTHLASVWKC